MTCAASSERIGGKVNNVAGTTEIAELRQYKLTKALIDVRRQRQSRQSIQKPPSDENAQQAPKEASFRAADVPGEHANAAQALSNLGRTGHSGKYGE